VETKFSVPKYPVENMEGSSKVDVHDVKCLEKGDQNMLGAVKVGGLYSADCFTDMDNDGDLY
jgi:hypothetical protein